ncbi:MAG: FAD-dependent thymidylate synthase, partial [Clostridia bacterium]|nr:FAD-dependent thymidylate synthase [Clostridia bacterium]
LPNAAETRIMMTMNARSLYNFFRLRCCNRAQWEIRDLAWAMLAEVRRVAPTLFANAGPACLTGACDQGRMSCKKMVEVRRRSETLCEK